MEEGGPLDMGEGGPLDMGEGGGPRHGRMGL